ncbi:bifunctional protein-serine/threonine kinase/phosphatase [Agarilytica rhodophyticola]|uniref:bifunctional protein-serine/threonine kinase/phosphatase n=1 Tax=Agarilytica rhodophyticola TaxID=1737490 RepID=UPI000B347402|nr:bifunctional protein-serine/threonine kinase/phosphatase [Agarilytica rhodophyticola]
MDHIHSTLDISLAQISDKGIKPENQDTIGARIPEGSALTTKGIAIAIADGVSSSASARQASQSAVTGFLTDYYATPDTWRTQQSAVQVIQSLNRYLWAQSQNNVRDEGYLTTFSCIIFKGDKCFIFHVGDTRVYRYRDNVLEQLTRDHSQKIDKKTTYLSRALGADPVLEIDMLSQEIQPGDQYLLSSDGIHDYISSHRIIEIINENKVPQDIAQTLIDESLNLKSEDNISIQVVTINQLGTPTKGDTVHVLSKLPFAPILEPKQIIDGYCVERIIHESERSQVYLVTDVDSKRRYIMKTPSINYEDDPAYIERFVMESWIGSRIQNAHVVKVVPAKQERRFLYYLTEYIAGPTLAQIIKERAPLDIKDAVELLEGVIKGVRSFHRKDTLHQDLKPDNIVLATNGPVIIDFGSCFVAGLQEMAPPFQRDKVLGTLDYSAPEYRYGGKVNEKSDQFSLAAILYEMLTTQLPYGSKYEKAMDIKAFQRLEYIPARRYNPLVPVWLDMAMEKALTIQPSSRYGSLSEWLLDLKRPNPNWLTAKETPLLEKDPLKVWQIFALLGWGLAIYLLVSGV